MFYIGCTRFNNSTYEENINYRLKHNLPVIYGSALKIRNIYLPEALIFVMEMNNDTNKIEGIGLIRNSIVHNKTHKIYDHVEYNRYIYSGKYWIKRELIDPQIIEICDKILFKGKSHLKCRSGISILTEKLFTHWDYKIKDLKNKIKNMFLTHFENNDELTSGNFDKEINNPKFDLDFELDPREEFLEIIPKKKRRLNND